MSGQSGLIVMGRKRNGNLKENSEMNIGLFLPLAALPSMGKQRPKKTICNPFYFQKVVLTITKKESSSPLQARTILKGREEAASRKAISEIG